MGASQAPRFGLGVAIGTMMGTLLEWYEAFLFSIGARYIGSAFFPSKDPMASLLATFIAFALGFAVRPLGALFWGWVGDRYGRRHVMFWTLTLGGLATVLIGIVPDYATIGLAAPLILVLLRILQGFSLGGEWGAAVNYIFENVKRRRRLLLAIVQSTVALGLLTAASVFLLLELVLGSNAVAAWGWRVAYWLAIIAVLIGLFFRLRFGETLEFLEAKMGEKERKNPVGEVFSRYWYETLAGIVLAGTAGAVFYYGNTFAPNIAVALKTVSSSQQFLAVIVFALVEIVGVVLSGVLAERAGPKATIVVASLLGIISALLIQLILQGFGGLLTIAVVAGFAHGLIYTAEAAFIAEIFPTLVRTTGLSVSYQFGNAIFAATAPMIMTSILQQAGGKAETGLFNASIYILALCILTAFIIGTFRKR
ncbi:MFS transporter [Pyrobaculum aerophilum]|uniref:MFS transporter n=1 Tax=Pyrobaculum aerophilum TaxID=13773 RepID=UPI0023F31F86|nr:MFS transporter [Pyrobaculum aerophilum]MCX8137627.1 MFS transporter [Pyrobaculum aerophilum]